MKGLWRKNVSETRGIVRSEWRPGDTNSATPRTLSASAPTNKLAFVAHLKVRYLYRFLLTVLLFVSLVVAYTLSQLVSQRIAPPKVRGLRVEPAYLYNTYPKVDSKRAARDIVEDAIAMNANTLLIQAYNSTYGAFYPAELPFGEVEHGIGKKGIFSAIVEEAHRRGIATVASIPINSFRSVWQAQPNWRVIQKDGADYVPAPNVYPLCVWSEGFREWYSNFVEDLIQRHPKLDGIEIVEGRIDYKWKGTVDFNPELISKFNTAHPGALVGDAVWKKFRAEGLTSLHGKAFEIAHRHHKSALIVQTWTAQKDGTLIDPEKLRDASGFDFMGIANLPKPSRPDFFVGEFIWQQWRSERGTSVFDPNWTASAAKTFVGKIRRRTRPIVHVELTKFGEIEPTLSEFQKALSLAVELSDGATFYDYQLVKARGASEVVRRAYRPTPLTETIERWFPRSSTHPLR